MTRMNHTTTNVHYLLDTMPGPRWSIPGAVVIRQCPSQQCHLQLIHTVSQVLSTLSLGERAHLPPVSDLMKHNHISGSLETMHTLSMIYTQIVAGEFILELRCVIRILCAIDV